MTSIEMKMGFGRVFEEETGKDVDFICDVLELHKRANVRDLFCGAGRHS